MLQSRNLSAVLAQSIQCTPVSDLSFSHKSILSSILITLNGQPVASSHTSKPPSPPRAETSSSELSDYDPLDESSSQKFLYSGRNPVRSVGTPNSTPGTNSYGSLKGQPYQITRVMKTKIYALFASSVWREYQEAGINFSSSQSDQLKTDSSLSSKDEIYTNYHDWITVKTEDEINIVISPVNLKSTASQLLLILVADEECPLGFLLKKLQETVKVLEEGLDKYRVVS